MRPNLSLIYFNHAKPKYSMKYLEAIEIEIMFLIDQ